MKYKYTVLVLQLITNAVFGYFYGHFGFDDKISHSVLTTYYFFTSFLMTIWCFLDLKGTNRAISAFPIVGVAIFNYWAIPVYLGVSRPGNSKFKSIGKALLFFIVCVTIFGNVCIWAFNSRVGP